MTMLFKAPATLYQVDGSAHDEIFVVGDRNTAGSSKPFATAFPGVQTMCSLLP